MRDNHHTYKRGACGTQQCTSTYRQRRECCTAIVGATGHGWHRKHGKYVSWTLQGFSAMLIACHCRIIRCETEDSNAHVRTQVCQTIQRPSEQCTRKALNSLMSSASFYYTPTGVVCCACATIPRARHACRMHLMNFNMGGAEEPWPEV